MQFTTVFAENGDVRNNNCLHSVVFSDEELTACGECVISENYDADLRGESEFQKLILKWKDPIHLAEFYSDNKQLFEQKYWRGINERIFVVDVRLSVPLIFKEIAECCNERSVDSLFEPFEKEYDYKADLKLEKAKFGHIFERVAFRVYGIRLEKNCYIITGGAIKLTEKLEQAEHTRVEIKKIEMVKSFLDQEGIYDNMSFIDLMETMR